MKQIDGNKLHSYLSPGWPENGPKNGISRPGNIHAFTTLVTGGNSKGDFREFNLAMHVGDDPRAVKANRRKLVTDLELPSEPLWLEQVHSDRVIIAEDYISHAAPLSAASLPVIRADASISRTPGVVCAVLTADCLPVFFCNRTGNEIAVAHAGWRGLHAGILANTVKSMQSSADDILVAMGPAIGKMAFEVGAEVFHAFLDKNINNQTAFVKNDQDRYLCDIYQLALIELQSVGVSCITYDNYCTFAEVDRFYSYRRQNITGRMASVIWMS